MSHFARGSFSPVFPPLRSFYGVIHPYSGKIQCQNNKKNPSKSCDAKQDSCNGNIKSQHCRNMKKTEKQKQGELASKDANPDPCRQRKQRSHACFQKHHFSDMAFFQSQNVVKPDFFLSVFHEKTVAVDQKDNAENSNNHFTGSYDHPHFCCLGHCFLQCGTVPQKFHHIHHGNAENAGKHIGNIGAPVIPDVLHCQFSKHSFTHRSHRLS